MKQSGTIITTWPDPQQLAQAVAHFIVLESRKAIAEKDFFTIALSGGSTPKLLYQLLATEPYKNNINWKKTIVAFGDERFVPRTSDESNYKMASDVLLSHVPIPKKNILGVQITNVTAAASAKRYEDTLKMYLTQKTPFDLILLGMGDDGHTASVFPGSELIDDRKNMVRSIWVEEKNMDRITFTLPFINRAKNIVFLVAGAKKAAMLKNVFSAKGKNLPAAQVKTTGQLYWFLDEAAASLI